MQRALNIPETNNANLNV